MKNKTSFIVNLLLCTALILGLFFSLITSFDISVNAPILVISTIIFCVVYALMSNLIQKKGMLFLGVAVTMIVFIFTLLFSLDYILAELSYAISQILGRYAVYLPVASSIAIGTKTATYATGIFVFASVIYSAVFTISLIRFGKLYIITIFSVLTLIPCFILVNTLPSVFCLITVITVLFALYLTKGVRRFNPPQSGVVTAIATTVTAVTLAVILTFNPIEGYTRFEWQDNMLKALQNITGLEGNRQNDLSKQLKTIDNSLQETDLSSIAELEQTGEKAMSVYSDTSGTLYLKGIAYADYEDNCWKLLSDSQAAAYPADFDSFTITKSNDLHTVKTKIITETDKPVIYTPYYTSEIPNGSSAFGDVCIYNDNKRLGYDIINYPLSPDSDYSLSIDDEKTEQYKEFVYDKYLKVPYETRANMFSIATKNDIENLSKSETITAVKALVSNSAKYSLDTPKMPEGEDFAVWFLKESSTGYCVHFATSAVLMLRTLGIPARYVTGYYVYANGSEWTDVTSDNAHAWAEYYDDNIGWIPLECTPSSFSPSGIIAQEPTEATNEPTTAEQATAQPTTAVSTNSASQPTSAPQSNNNNSKQSFKLPDGVVTAMLCVGTLAAIILAIILRKKIITSKRRRLMQTGSNKQRTVNVYRYLLFLQKYSHFAMPDEVLQIYEKARFSEHSISDEELKLVIIFKDNSFAAFWNELSSLKKLYYKYIVVLSI